jgi:hypothetical protein
MQTLTAYKSDDGRLFNDKSECLRHEAHRIMLDHYKDSEDVPDTHALRWIIDNHVDVMRFLSDLHKNLLCK